GVGWVWVALLSSDLVGCGVEELKWEEKEGGWGGFLRLDWLMGVQGEGLGLLMGLYKVVIEPLLWWISCGEWSNFLSS
uniref:hypothetical protein n=1 Tax=Paenibacillus xylanexedens TaxID=528191 RepID=UPI001C92E9DF